MGIFSFLLDPNDPAGMFVLGWICMAVVAILILRSEVPSEEGSTADAS